MPDYVFERLDTEEQVLVFRAKNLEMAIYELRREMYLGKYKYEVEYRKHSAIISIKLPFNQELNYLVGEVGRSD